MGKQLLFLSFLVCTVPAWGQFSPSNNFLDLGISLAATNYSGDIAEPHLELPQTSYGASAFLRYQLHPMFMLRGQFFAGKIAGDDKHSPVHAGRNFRFSTRILEASGLLELAFATIRYDPMLGEQSRYIMPYVVAGAGVAFTRSTVTYYGPPALQDKFVRTTIPEGAVLPTRHFWSSLSAWAPA